MRFSTTSILSVGTVATIASSCLVDRTDGFQISPTIAPPRRQSPSVTELSAKKKKKKGGGGKQQKKGGFEWASNFTLKPQEATLTRELASTAATSFKARTGKSLAPELDGGVMDIPKALWDASVACMIVDQDENGDTIVKYANVAALETVGLTAGEFEKLYSTSIKEEERQQVKPVVSVELPSAMNGEKKYESGYKKKMLKKEEGEDITIIQAHRWAIEKSTLTPEGKFETTSMGVAYAWSEWMVGEDMIYSPGGSKRIAVDPAKLEEKVTAKAAYIRSLKEDKGLGNKDPEVMEAVQELIALKEALEEVKQSS